MPSDQLKLFDVFLDFHELAASVTVDGNQVRIPVACGTTPGATDITMRVAITPATSQCDAAPCTLVLVQDAVLSIIVDP